MSWIHLDDLARLILFCVENQSLNGPVNGTAPWPARNLDFTQALAGAVRRPAIFNVPAFALRLLGEFSDELLGSKRVLPGVASAQGFPFEFPELPAALKHLL
jgi:NAD dependent epimerase/dehydratase family enzyme